MTDYTAPVADLSFTLRELAGLEELAGLPGQEDLDPDLVEQVLEEAARFASGVLAPLNREGDRVGAVLENGVVRCAPGFADAYRQFCDGGWNGLPATPDHGGQGLPWLVQSAVSEMWNAANMSFGVCPLLTQGAIELLTLHGSEEQKRLYLGKLIAGTWTGTMNLTEPHSGSDLGLLKTRAVRDGDHYRITGQKIFITWGEHDAAENIVHMVLARTPDAPAGVRGISLFIVPKVLVGPDGRPGERNDLRCVSLEHKLGIHASPTAVMAYGDDGGAVGYLVGRENEGLEYMFAMMNNARLGVGVQGVAIAERAYQQAAGYARQRLQGRDLARRDGGAVPIIRHPDIRRMLLRMRASTEAARAMALVTAGGVDLSRHHPDPAVRVEQAARVELLTPLVKAWATDVAVEVTSLNVQVHGGMGFIEESGAAQHYRDARILPIYEGTNGIQANDLVFRKVLRDKGAAMRDLLEEMRGVDAALAEATASGFPEIRRGLSEATRALEAATGWRLAHGPADPKGAAAAAVPYLRLAGLTVGCWLMARGALAAAAALAAGEGDPRFLRAKQVTARYFAEALAPEAAMQAEVIHRSGATVNAFDEEAF